MSELVSAALSELCNYQAETYIIWQAGVFLSILDFFIHSSFINFSLFTGFFSLFFSFFCLLCLFTISEIFFLQIFRLLHFYSNRFGVLCIFHHPLIIISLPDPSPHSYFPSMLLPTTNHGFVPNFSPNYLPL